MQEFTTFHGAYYTKRFRHKCILDNCTKYISVSGFSAHVAEEHSIPKENPIRGIVLRVWRELWEGLPRDARTCARVPEQIKKYLNDYIRVV